MKNEVQLGCKSGQMQGVGIAMAPQIDVSRFTVYCFSQAKLDNRIGLGSPGGSGTQPLDSSGPPALALKRNGS